MDWDLDGVANSDEPVPESFLQQVQVMQCTLAGGDYMAVLNGGGFYTPEIIDRQYVIVVGGETDTGVYELMIRELID